MEACRPGAVEVAPALEAEGPQLLVDHDAAHDLLRLVAGPAERDRLFAAENAQSLGLLGHAGFLITVEADYAPFAGVAGQHPAVVGLVARDEILELAGGLEDAVGGRKVVRGDPAAVGLTGLLALYLVVDPAHLGDGSVGDPQHHRAGPLVPHRDRYDRQLLGRPPQEGPVVPTDVVPAVGGGPHRHLAGRGQVADVEQRHFGPGDATLLVGVGSHPQHQRVADGVQVAGEPGDLQLSQDLGVGRVGEVDGVEGVDLTERHHVADVAHEAHRLDVLAPADVAHRADLGQHVAVGAQHPHLALGILAPRIADRGDDPQVPVVLRERELVADHAQDLAGGLVGGRGVADVEAVDAGAALAPSPEPAVFVPSVAVAELLGVDPAGGGHIQRPDGRIDGVAGRHHRGGPRRVELAADGHADHGGDPETGEHRRGVHVIAGNHQRSCRAVGRSEGVVGQPVVEGGVEHCGPVGRLGDILASLVLGVHEREVPLGVVAQDHPGGSVHAASADVVALHVQGLDDFGAAAAQVYALEHGLRSVGRVAG